MKELLILIVLTLIPFSNAFSGGNVEVKGPGGLIIVHSGQCVYRSTAGHEIVVKNPATKATGCKAGDAWMKGSKVGVVYTDATGVKRKKKIILAECFGDCCSKKTEVVFTVADKSECKKAGVKLK